MKSEIFNSRLLTYCPENEKSLLAMRNSLDLELKKESSSARHTENLWKLIIGLHSGIDHSSYTMSKVIAILYGPYKVQRNSSPALILGFEQNHAAEKINFHCLNALVHELHRKSKLPHYFIYSWFLPFLGNIEGFLEKLNAITYDACISDHEIMPYQEYQRSQMFFNEQIKECSAHCYNEWSSRPWNQRWVLPLTTDTLRAQDFLKLGDLFQQKSEKENNRYVAHPWFSYLLEDVFQSLLIAHRNNVDRKVLFGIAQYGLNHRLTEIWPIFLHNNFKMKTEKEKHYIVFQWIDTALTKVLSEKIIPTDDLQCKYYLYLENNFNADPLLGPFHFELSNFMTLLASADQKYLDKYDSLFQRILQDNSFTALELLIRNQSMTAFIEDFLLTLIAKTECPIPDHLIEGLLIQHFHQLSFFILQHILSDVLSRHRYHLLPLFFQEDQNEFVQKNLLVYLLEYNNPFIVEAIQQELVQKLYHEQWHSYLQKAYVILLEGRIRSTLDDNHDQVVFSTLSSLLEVIMHSPKNDRAQYTPFLMELSAMNSDITLNLLRKHHTLYPGSLDGYLAEAICRRDYTLALILLDADVLPPLNFSHQLDFYNIIPASPARDFSVKQSINFLSSVMPFLITFQLSDVYALLNFIIKDENAALAMLTLLNDEQCFHDSILSKKEPLSLFILLSKGMIMKEDIMSQVTVRILSDLYALADLSQLYPFIDKPIVELSSSQLNNELAHALNCKLYPIALLLWQCGAKINPEHELHQWLFMKKVRGSLESLLRFDEMNQLTKLTDSLIPGSKPLESRFALLFSTSESNQEIFDCSHQNRARSKK